MITMILERKICRLLHYGMSISDIAERMNLPEDVIAKTCKISNLPRKKIQSVVVKKVPERMKKTCHRCRSKILVFPCLACYPEGGRGASGSMKEAQSPGKVPPKESLELLRIVEDIRYISDHELIVHPLFISLSKRAENVLAKIAGPR